MDIGQGSKETDLLYRFMSKFGVKEIDDLMDHLPRSLVHSRRSPAPIGATSQSGNMSKDDVISQLFNLDVDVISMMANDDQICSDGQQASEFAALISQTLESCPHAKIVSFRIKYPFTYSYTDDIYMWVQSALEKKVRHLVLDFSHTDMSFRPTISPLVHFTEGEGSPFLEHLSLSTCRIPWPVEFMDFRSLTSLFLENVYLYERLLVLMLLPRLPIQWVSIKRCCGRRPFDVILPGRFCKLKHVNISKCHNVKKIKIKGPSKLASLECSATALIKGSSIRNISRLRRLCFVEVEDSLAGVSYACGRLASDLPQLETLMLSLQTIEKDMILKKLPAFTKLKHLVLLDCGSSDRSLFYLTTFLMKASPCLHKLELHLPHSMKKNAPKIHKEEGEEAMQIDDEIRYEECYHHNLKYVKIYGFQGFEAEIHLTTFLLKYALVLKSMKINRQVRDYDGNGEWIVRAARNDIKRRQIRKLFFKDVASTTKLIVL